MSHQATARDSELYYNIEISYSVYRMQHIRHAEPYNKNKRGYLLIPFTGYIVESTAEVQILHV